MEILKLYKNIGETPLECLERFRAKNPEYKNVKMTYAGRLDPMAEGLLLVLAGDIKDKQKYLNLNKIYKFEVLFGFETDTNDILGLVKNIKNKKQTLYHSDISLWQALEKIKNIKIQKYPVFSSKTVKGKPLFMWAREGKIKDIEIPKRNIKIFYIKNLGVKKITKNKLQKEILKRISKVRGDFRQKEIIGQWKKALKNTKEKTFYIYKFETKVSSGTYVRNMASEVGRILKTGATAYSIKRTKVGNLYCRLSLTKQ